MTDYCCSLSIIWLMRLMRAARRDRRASASISIRPRAARTRTPPVTSSIRGCSVAKDLMSAVPWAMSVGLGATVAAFVPAVDEASGLTSTGAGLGIGCGVAAGLGAGAGTLFIATAELLVFAGVGAVVATGVGLGGTTGSTAAGVGCGCGTGTAAGICGAG